MTLPLGHKAGRCDCLEKEGLGCGVNQLRGGTKFSEGMEFATPPHPQLMNADLQRELQSKPSKIIGA